MGITFAKPREYGYRNRNIERIVTQKVKSVLRKSSRRNRRSEEDPTEILEKLARQSGQSIEEIGDFMMEAGLNPNDPDDIMQMVKLMREQAGGAKRKGGKSITRRQTRRT